MSAVSTPGNSPVSASCAKELPPAAPESIAKRLSQFRRDLFWRQIPMWREIDENKFLDFRWQEQNAIVHANQLATVLRDLAPPEFISDARRGGVMSPMSPRVPPYLLSLIDWTDAYRDPIRRQYIPLASELEPDHPMSMLDSLGERSHSPVHGLIHRYPSKALFLALDTCPVYCRCCTRSYGVGLDTERVAKIKFPIQNGRWEAALSYIAQRTELVDIVVSGGDAYRLTPDQIRSLGHCLLDIPHIRRFRFATKGLAVQPMKLLTDSAWVDALTAVVARGRRLRKEVSIQTHFNHPAEITGISEDAMAVLFERGITVRNQSVLQRGVNDTAEVMIELCRRLGAINVHPYYVYVHDLVPGTEDLRTSVATAVALEKQVRGTTAGFNTPVFVVDTPGGGGKRDVHSFESYDAQTGISIYGAPSVRPGQLFPFFDPLRSLAPAIQEAWQDPVQRRQMISEALLCAK